MTKLTLNTDLEKKIEEKQVAQTEKKGSSLKSERSDVRRILIGVVLVLLIFASVIAAICTKDSWIPTSLSKPNKMTRYESLAY